MSLSERKRLQSHWSSMLRFPRTDIPGASRGGARGPLHREGSWAPGQWVCWWVWLVNGVLPGATAWINPSPYTSTPPILNNAFLQDAPHDASAHRMSALLVIWWSSFMDEESSLSTFPDPGLRIPQLTVRAAPLPPKSSWRPTRAVLSVSLSGHCSICRLYSLLQMWVRQNLWFRKVPPGATRSSR